MQPSLAAELSNDLDASAAQASNTIRILSSAEKCRRVARRIILHHMLGEASWRLRVWFLIFVPSSLRRGAKSSLNHNLKSAP